MKLSISTAVITAAAALFSIGTPTALSAPAVADEILVEPKMHLSEQAVQALFGVHGAHEVRSIPQINVRVLRVPAAKRDRVLEALKHNPNIEFAEPNSVATAGALTNDPYVTNGTEWHVSKIQADQAWSITSGTANTVVAIVDSGVAANHPDLAGRVLPGYNFVAGNTNAADDFGHGTAVAGTVAAQGNNGIGVAGVAWSASLLPIKVTDATGSASYSNMASGITYAADHGARVINISLAGATSSSTLQNAVNYAWSRNVVIVAAAANNGNNTPQYPAACTNVLGVSATDSTDTIASWSNYGSYVSLSAPGSGIATTNMDGTYGSWSGTSLASPVAAGVAALVAAYNPQLTNAAIADLLKQNSDDLGANGYDVYYGYGRVNAYRALLAAGSAPVDTIAPTTAIASPGTGSTVSGSITLQVNASDDTGVTKIELYIDGVLAGSSSQAPATFAWDTRVDANGMHTLRALAYDAAGNVGTSTDVSVDVQNGVADTIPPTTQILSPTAGTIVSRTLKVYTATSDNVGVVRVELYRDGALAASSTTPSAIFSLNTSKWSKGNHTLQAMAYDAAGNAGASVAVSVSK